ncbi:MAG: hypothetical protein ACI3XJ_07770 [Oscillospiraceae bacterium]
MAIAKTMLNNRFFIYFPPFDSFTADAAHFFCGRIARKPDRHSSFHIPPQHHLSCPV